MYVFPKRKQQSLHHGLETAVNGVCKECKADQGKLNRGSHLFFFFLNLDIPSAGLILSYKKTISK